MRAAADTRKEFVVVFVSQTYGCKVFQKNFICNFQIAK